MNEKKDIEVHIYLGTADNTEKSGYKYPSGERHAFLFFLLEKIESDYNIEKAQTIIKDIGFQNIEFTKVGKIDKTSQTLKDSLKKAYNDAIKNGSSFICYSDPI